MYFCKIKNNLNNINMNKKLTVLAVGMLIASTAVLVSAKLSKENMGDVAVSEVESLTSCEKVE